MVRWLAWIALACVAGSSGESIARACGGFFCNTAPVDQTRERILFVVGETQMTMVVQIRYQGAAEDFAWILPLGDVPAPGSLQTFPGVALTLLDRITSPASLSGCPPGMICLAAGESDLTVHEQTVVGPYEAAVIESRDAAELIAWLRAHGYRVSIAMEPLLALYAGEGNAFLALRLRPGLDTTDIQPIAMTLPGRTPTIPLRLTAVAAEPEMGIVVTIAAAHRYAPATWPAIHLDPDRVAAGGWETAVARAVDDAGGHGFVLEWAGRSDTLLARLSTAPSSAGRDALTHVLERHPYVTRFYTRVSPEEMTSDPLFRRSDGGDLQITGFGRSPGDPCARTTCGALGLCVADGARAGCACRPGATARATSTGEAPCIDASLSFLGPGDVTSPGATPLPDPCVGYDCGQGVCVAVNLAPTCACDPGRVAVPLGGPGTTSVLCTAPASAVPGWWLDGRAGPTDGCSIAGRGGAGSALLVLAILVSRRRRRRTT